jgi:hypothetical protein
MNDGLPRRFPDKLSGAVHGQYVRCGKPNCKCASGELHDPYYYRFWREWDGKLYMIIEKRFSRISREGRPSGLGWCQHTFAEQVEAGAAIHRTLDQLEPVDLAFHLAVAPGQRQTCSHSSQVPLESGGEAAKLSDAAGSSPCDPVCQRIDGASPHHVDEILGQCVGHGDLGDGLL